MKLFYLIDIVSYEEIGFFLPLLIVAYNCYVAYCFISAAGLSSLRLFTIQ